MNPLAFPKPRSGGSRLNRRPRVRRWPRPWRCAGSLKGKPTTSGWSGGRRLRGAGQATSVNGSSTTEGHSTASTPGSGPAERAAARPPAVALRRLLGHDDPRGGLFQRPRERDAPTRHRRALARQTFFLLDPREAGLAPTGLSKDVLGDRRRRDRCNSDEDVERASQIQRNLTSPLRCPRQRRHDARKDAEVSIAVAETARPVWRHTLALRGPLDAHRALSCRTDRVSLPGRRHQPGARHREFRRSMVGTGDRIAERAVRAAWPDGRGPRWPAGCTTR